MGFFADLVSTVASVSILTAFTWAVYAHFKSDKTPTGTKLILFASSFSALVFTILIWTEIQPVAVQFVAVAIELASAALFAVTIEHTKAIRFRLAFDEQHPDELVTSGPYRFVRHPFYTSYLVFWTGFALTTWSLMALPLLLIIYALYFSAALGEERKFEKSPMADKHRQYREQAGLFWPKLGRKFA